MDDMRNLGEYAGCGTDSSEDESLSDEEVGVAPDDAEDESEMGTSNLMGNGTTSIEDLIKRRNKIGIKKLEKELITKKKMTDNIEKRRNKNCPQEISSKKRVPFNKMGKYSEKKRAIRDPRFDALCGSEFNQEVFDKRYGFLDAKKSTEIKKLEKQLKKTKDPQKISKLKYIISRNKQQVKAKEQRLEKRQIEKEWKQKEKVKVADGKKPYFLKKSEKKELYKSASLKQNGNSTRVNKRKEEMKTKKELANLNLKRRFVKTT